ncbi:MAG: helix-turn-helix transcriptional regulator [Ardenticatenaceae bacterium]|nr:helix-turn-helix transcriptional regulator [Anaerolineales bacterium]MCB8919984.1 helix-turn-helix transcriptional regulator [Ardenticatenaceae bacterium]MCB8989831.1 helix-turn-helix transcriptional regulator [Ardenticatenaceae bacterium]
MDKDHFQKRKMEIADNIHWARRKKGWTQKRLSEEIGFISRQKLYRIEKGTVDLTICELETLADMLDVSLNDLIDPRPY